MYIYFLHIMLLRHKETEKFFCRPLKLFARYWQYPQTEVNLLHLVESLVPTPDLRPNNSGNNVTTTAQQQQHQNKQHQQQHQQLRSNIIHSITVQTNATTSTA